VGPARRSRADRALAGVARLAPGGYPKSMQILEVVTVGLPFCVFKILAGLRAMERFPDWWLLAGALVVLGVLDLLINLVNLGSLLIFKRRTLDACVFAAAARLFKPPASPDWTWQDLGNSLDVLLAMSIVAVMIGTRAFSSFPSGQLALWNTCVILDVLGAGLSRFGSSLKRISSGPPPERRLSA